MFKTLKTLETLKKIVNEIQKQGFIELSSLSSEERRELVILCENGYCVVMKSAKWDSNSNLETIYVVWPTHSRENMIKIIISLLLRFVH
ncbi:MAG: hypothetical protein PHR47_02400 [Candidatus Pacebacteria bacterium]|nr:hypothetical protein [Candidatus Paceibacterota bacterium]